MIDLNLPIDSIFLNLCQNSFCLLSTVKYLRHRRRQLLPLYSLYDSDAKTGICCNHLMWVVVVIELFFYFTYYVLNWIFCFSCRREIICEHWYYPKRMPSVFFVECLLTNPSSVSIRGIRWRNPSHTTPSRCRIIPFSLVYHQSHDVKYSVTLFRSKQPTTYTHSLSSQNIDIVSFIPNRFESIDPTTTTAILLTTISFLVLVWGEKYFVSIDIIQNEYRPPLSLSLYLRIRYRLLLH